MHLHYVGIKNILGIEEFEMRFDANHEPGWHVLIGENGSGKTTILKSIASALLGERFRSFYSGDNLVRKGHTHGQMVIKLPLVEASIGRPAYFPTVIISFPKGSLINEREETVGQSKELSTSILEAVEKGFSVGYGTFRNFKGLDQDHFKQVGIRRFQTLFSDQQGLGSVSEWFKDRIVEANNENDTVYRNRARLLIDSVFGLINKSAILPTGFEMLRHVSPDGPLVRDPNGFESPAQGMSEGVRSVLALVLDILINMAEFFPLDQFRDALDLENGSVNLPGIVLIDEVDAHLHPSWQAEIGNHLMGLFPQIQFIVTTHSPIICRAAERGSIWKLPALGSGEREKRIEGEARNKLIYGNILQAVGTELFGEVAQSEAAFIQEQELADLEMKELWQPLTKAEKKRLKELQAIF